MVRSWDVATDLPSVNVDEVFDAERAELVAFLARLTPDAWSTPTLCPGWSVHDVALHLLGNDLGRVGDRSADHRSAALAYAELAELIEDQNEEWVRAARRIAPDLLVELLELTGARVTDVFSRLDPWQPGVAVAWTGDGPSPAWLDIAREYTERWVHHAQIREAVGQSPLSERRWLHPVLETFMRSLPRAYEDVQAPDGTRVAVTVGDEAGGRWLVHRRPDRWRLAEGAPPFDAELRMPAEVAWKLLTRSIPVATAIDSITMDGDPTLTAPGARAVAIMTTRL